MILADALRTPLAELRAYWLETRCLCPMPQLSPVWFHAARRPDWLLSDLALDHACSRCHVQPAMALLRCDRVGAPDPARRLEVCEAFEE